MKDILTRTLTGSILGILFFAAYLYAPPVYFSLILLGILLEIMIFEWPQLYTATNPLFFILMTCYPIVPFMLLVYLNQHPAYHSLLLLLFVLVCSHDIGSYFAGRLFGRHAIVPSISPGKTWEGFFGGYLISLAAVGGLAWYTTVHVSSWWIGLLTFALCSLSLSGDLFESWLKRRAGIKDTGDILPGHGGFLDRFDGILFVVVCIYLLRTYLSAIISR